MKKLLVLTGALVLSVAVSATNYNNVPPDYPAQVSQSTDAQIEMVRRNYEDVKAKAARKAARQKALAEQERKAKQAAAAEKAAQKAARQAKLEKRADQEAELHLELKRIELKRAQSKLKVDEALDNETIRHAEEIVKSRIESGKK